MNVVYISQFRDCSGYASAARSYLKAVDASLLKSEENINFKVYTVPIEHTSSLTKEEEALLKKYELTNEDVDEFLMNDYTMVWHMPPSMIMIGQNFVEPIYWNNVVKLLENSERSITHPRSLVSLMGVFLLLSGKIELALLTLWPTFYKHHNP